MIWTSCTCRHLERLSWNSPVPRKLCWISSEWGHSMAPLTVLIVGIMDKKRCKSNWWWQPGHLLPSCTKVSKEERGNEAEEAQSWVGRKNRERCVQKWGTWFTLMANSAATHRAVHRSWDAVQDQMFFLLILWPFWCHLPCTEQHSERSHSALLTFSSSRPVVTL